MARCCDPRDCGQVFTGRFARRRARRYARRGLDPTARRMVDLLAEHGVNGATVLEVGGGVGELQLELLRAGAARALNLELSPGYEAEASRLAAGAGLAGRVHRRQLDLATEPGAVEPADVVVLNRVVCCYPDYERLLGAAADHARRHLVFSYPRRNAVSRAVVAVQNALFRLQGSSFRVFTHPPAAMLAVVAERGLRAAVAHRGTAWQIALASR